MPRKKKEAEKPYENNSIACDNWPECEDRNCEGCRNKNNPVKRGQKPPSLIPKCVQCGTTEDLKETENETDATLCEECHLMLNGKPEKEAFTPPPTPEIPPEYINYRMALKDFLNQKTSLEYHISSLKAQLKAVEKRIEDMNKQFANGEYTGELFSQEKNEKPIEESPRPTKREDGPEYEQFLMLVNTRYTQYAEVAGTLEEEELFRATLCDFITDNDESATARLLYSKAKFVEDEETGKYTGFELPEVDDHSDFESTFVAEADSVEYSKYAAKWVKILETDDEEKAECMALRNPEAVLEEEDEDTEANKPIHKYDPATGKSRRGHHA